MNYDLIIVGGGINGCGIARDAAMRGLSCVLLEKNDFGSETTGASSQMIHGGARYLLSNRRTTRLSSLDSGYIQKIAPHLLFPIPFIYPILKKPGWPLWMRRFYFEVIESFFEVYDRFAPYKNGKPHHRLSPEQVLKIEPDLCDDLVGAISFDEWAVDTNRLCIHNVLAAQENGATCLNHTSVTKILKEAGRVVGVWTRNEITGEELEVRAKIIVNATGPWADRLAKMAKCRVPLRPAKGIHLALDRRLTNWAILTKAMDQRSIFMMPYQNITMIGTTDDDYFGDPGNIPILEDEVDYLMEGIARVFPRVREARVTHSWAGVRPTLYKRGPYEDDLSRDHEIFDHEKNEGTAGFLSIAGGKLASYRLMSEEMVDAVVKKLGHGGECRSHLVPLPGAERKVEASDLVKQFGILPMAAHRLIYRYGGRAYEVLELTRESVRYGNISCDCDPVLEAELRYAIRKEGARTLGDLKRRTRTTLGPCQGLRCLMGAAQVLSEELGLPPSQVREELKQFQQKRWDEKRPVLNGVAWQEEELFSQSYFGSGALG